MHGFRVHPGFYIVSFKGEHGWGSQDVRVDTPQEPETFIKMVRDKISNDHGKGEYIIIAVSKIAGGPKQKRKDSV